MFRSDAVDKHEQLEFEEDDRIDGWASHAVHVAVVYQIVYEREVEYAVQVAVEAVRGD